MKKLFVVLCIAVAASACGGKKTTGSSDSTAEANHNAKAAETNADTNSTKIGTEKPAGVTMPGAKLMADLDCGTCHKDDSKVVGPALKDIAAKYPPTDSNIEMLANKIIKGGSGHWGDVPMTPHPTLALADAKIMVQYILSLKK